MHEHVYIILYYNKYAISLVFFLGGQIKIVKANMRNTCITAKL